MFTLTNSFLIIQMKFSFTEMNSSVEASITTLSPCDNNFKVAVRQLNSTQRRILNIVDDIAFSVAFLKESDELNISEQVSEVIESESESEEVLYNNKSIELIDLTEEISSSSSKLNQKDFSRSLFGSDSDSFSESDLHTTIDYTEKLKLLYCNQILRNRKLQDNQNLSTNKSLSVNTSNELDESINNCEWQERELTPSSDSSSPISSLNSPTSARFSSTTETPPSSPLRSYSPLCSENQSSPNSSINSTNTDKFSTSKSPTSSRGGKLFNYLLLQLK